MELLLTTNETAAILGVQVQTLAMWRLYKRGPRYTKMGRLVKYRRSDIEAFIERNSVGEIV